MNNAELLVRQLEASGVRWVFGIPSGPVLPLIEALRRSPSVEFVLTTSESSAGFMAAVVGQLSGRPGACVATVGPGATNLATGVGAAWLDCAPALAITCNVPTAWLERRIQMRIDHQALFRPLTKASFGLRAASVGDQLAEALAIARAEPPGPVHLDLPEDVAQARAADPLAAPPAPPRLPDVAAEAARQATRALAGSRRPLLVLGLSATRLDDAARSSLRRFVDRQNLPFVTTTHAKGVLPESHPGWAGVIGRARRTDVAAFVQQADLVLGLGYDPIEINYEEWLGPLPLLHVDSQPADIGPEVQALANLGGDLAGALAALAELPPSLNDWQPAELAEHRLALDAALRPPGYRFAPHEALDLLRARLPADGILAYDVGAHTHQIASQWRTDLPNTCIVTNGWSSMGFGLPAAYAARLVHPERAVVGVVGDGCFQMTVGELSLARRLNLAVPIVVLNDGWLGLMKVKQERKEYALSGVELGLPPPPSPPHYFGVPCRPAHSPAEFAAALDWAFGLDGPSVVEAFVDVAPYSQTVFD